MRDLVAALWRRPRWARKVCELREFSVTIPTIASHVTTTSSPDGMFTQRTRDCGHDWYDEELPVGRSNYFIHVRGDEFKPDGDTWFARYESLPLSQDEARSRFVLPSHNPATHVHVFCLDIPENYAGLTQPVVLLGSKENTTKVWQGKLQDQLVKFIKHVQTIPLK